VSITATQLFANYTPSVDAAERCFYCGGQCSQEHKSKDVVKSSFTALDTVTRSDYVCGGCIVAFDENATVTLLCGDVRVEQKTRLYSWIVYGGKRYAATKAHRAQIAELCMNPPAPPYVISLADSGQRQLLYRAKVCTDRVHATVSLEGDSIAYRPEQLEQRLKLMKQVCVATGKPALLDTITPQTGMRVIDYYGDDIVFSEWQKTQSESLTRLAAWICPPKEECANEFAGYEIVGPAKADGPVESAGGQTTFSWAD
jgi:hypothetical protein